jgi:hypothetical protein
MTVHERHQHPQQQPQHSASPFPSAYVDPTAITKRESSSDDDDMLYLPAASASTECYSQATDAQPPSDSSWAAEESSNATVDVDGAFDVVSQGTFGAEDEDDAGADAAGGGGGGGGVGGSAYGFNTYDSVEFQTLKEHCLQPSISDQYLRL